MCESYYCVMNKFGFHTAAISCTSEEGQ